MRPINTVGRALRAESRRQSRASNASIPAQPRWRQPLLRRIPWLRLGVIAAGGILGALARQSLQTAFPHPAGGFDWTMLGINVAGCGLIGVLMVAITEVRHAHRLTASFLGVGVLGGFTSFSTYIIDIQKSIGAGAPQIALAYLAATLATALLAVAAGMTLTRLIARPHGRDSS
jgi:fluoride exporter